MLALWMFTFIISAETQTNMQIHELKLQNHKYAKQLAEEQEKLLDKQKEYERKIKYKEEEYHILLALFEKKYTEELKAQQDKFEAELVKIRGESHKETNQKGTQERMEATILAAVHRPAGNMIRNNTSFETFS